MRQGHELVPPSAYNLGYIETNQKCNWNGRTEAVSINTYQFKVLFVSGMIEQHMMIQNGEKKVDDNEDQYIIPNQLVHRVLPSTQQINHSRPRPIRFTILI